MLGMTNHFDISDSIEIREVDIAGVACISSFYISNFMALAEQTGLSYLVENPKDRFSHDEAQIIP